MRCLVLKDDETPIVKPGVDIGSPKIEEQEKTEESSEEETEETSESKESSPEVTSPEPPTSPEVTSPEVTSPEVTSPDVTSRPSGNNTAPLPSPTTPSISDIARVQQQQQEANKENKEQNVIDNKTNRKTDDPSPTLSDEVISTPFNQLQLLFPFNWTVVRRTANSHLTFHLPLSAKRINGEFSPFFGY